MPQATLGHRNRHRTGSAVETLTRVARILERSSAELSLSHYRILAMLAQGSDRASRLAERLTLGKPAVSAAVESLVARGLVSRLDTDPDCRAIRLSLTPLGVQSLERAEGAMGDELDSLLSQVERPAEVRRSLDQLALALERRRTLGQARSPLDPGGPG